MKKKTVALGFLGTQLDSGRGAGRWEKWRPTVSLVQHQDMLVDRLELIYTPAYEALAQLASAEDCAGLHLATLGKTELIGRVARHGPLPRKSFSMGEADEKRFYLEARRIRS